MNTALVYVLSGLLSVVGSSQSQGIDADIRSAYQEAIESPDANARSGVMRALVQRLVAAPAEELRVVNEDSVDLLAGLLEMNGDVGRFYGAQALSAVSCSSKSALPSLRRALAQKAPLEAKVGLVSISPSVSPYDELKRAIAMIEVATPCL